MLGSFLDSYCRFYRSGHFEGFLTWEVRLVGILRMELGVSNDLVIGLCSHHEAAVAVYLLRQFSSRSGGQLLLISSDGLSLAPPSDAFMGRPSNRLVKNSQFIGFR